MAQEGTEALAPPEPAALAVAMATVTLAVTAVRVAKVAMAVPGERARAAGCLSRREM